jgi:D-alanine-D-alanine ligase
MKPSAPIKSLRILMLIEEGLTPPDSIEGLNEEQIAPFKTEWDVWSSLKKMGHEVQKLELHNELGAVRDAIGQFKPQIAFNLMEGFRGNPIYDQHVVSYLELIEQAYTGCNPRGMTLARDKALTKKIMAYHRIRVPAFAVFARGRAITRPKKLAFPLLVKSVSVEGSIGISQASIVHDEEKLKERVKFIHDSLQTFAIAEQFIEGRELYVGVMGNLRLQTLPVWELIFEKVPEDQPRIATRRSKFNAAYQKKWGITSRAAQGLPEGMGKELAHLCKRIFRILGLTGYARLDFRLTPTGELYLLEANPNPQIACSEDFADSAKAAGMGYEELIERILKLGLSYSPEALC